MGSEPWAAVMDGWKARSVTLNRPVRIVTARGELSGTAVDVDENGALLLNRAGG